MTTNRAYIAAYHSRLAARLNPPFSPMATSSRLKAPSLSSRLEFERAIDDLARTTIVLRKIEARRDEKIQSVRAEFEPDVNEAKARVASLTLLTEKYALDHRDELLPGKAKSAETPLATWGFRLGQPTLKLLSRAWTWEKVVGAIKTGLAHGSDFIRKKEEADKEALKRLPAGVLADIGVRIDQEETYFVEPKEQPTDIGRVGGPH